MPPSAAQNPFVVEKRKHTATVALYEPSAPPQSPPLPLSPRQLPPRPLSSSSSLGSPEHLLCHEEDEQLSSQAFSPAPGFRYCSEQQASSDGGLAVRNARDLPAFRQAYDHLVAYAQDASHREAICSELAQIGIQHFNLIDVVYELVLMGVMQGSRPPIFPPPGGFLEHLMSMICSFCPVSAESRPRAEQYLFVLQSDSLCRDEVMLLLDNIFDGEEHNYADPGSLALSLWDCLEKHIQHLLSRLEAT